MNNIHTEQLTMHLRDAGQCECTVHDRLTNCDIFFHKMTFNFSFHHTTIHFTPTHLGCTENVQVCRQSRNTHITYIVLAIKSNT